MRLFRSSDPIESYKRLRATGRELVPKILKATRDSGHDMLKAARKITLPVQGRTLIFDDETDQNALMDFFIHEFRAGGRRVVDCCDPEAMGLSPDERDLLEAHRHARASLFAVESVDGRNAQLRLRDLLEPQAPEVMLSDLSMSSIPEAAGELLIYTRVLACQGIEMGAGSFFGFSARHRDRLLEAHAARMESVTPGERSERTFIFFYQRHRDFGEAQAYA